MTIKDALWREVKYKLCGAGGLLEDLVAQDHVCVDARDDIDAENDPEDYPWLIISRVTRTEPNPVRYPRERFQFEAIGLLRDTTVGDDRLEQIMDILQNYFGNKHATIGKFTATGGTDTNGGLRVKGEYVQTTDAFSSDEQEKVQIVEFAFGYIRA